MLFEDVKCGSRLREKHFVGFGKPTSSHSPRQLLWVCGPKKRLRKWKCDSALRIKSKRSQGGVDLTKTGAAGR